MYMFSASTLYIRNPAGKMQSQNYIYKLYINAYVVFVFEIHWHIVLSWNGMSMLKCVVGDIKWEGYMVSTVKQAGLLGAISRSVIHLLLRPSLKTAGLRFV